MERTLIRDLKGRKDGEEVTAYGWLQESRKLKSVSFLILRDHTGILQVTLKPENIGNMDELATLNRESVLAVRGQLKLNAGARSGVEILAKKSKSSIGQKARCHWALLIRWKLISIQG